MKYLMTMISMLFLTNIFSLEGKHPKIDINSIKISHSYVTPGQSFYVYFKVTEKGSKIGFFDSDWFGVILFERLHYGGDVIMKSDQCFYNYSQDLIDCRITIGKNTRLGTYEFSWVKNQDEYATISSFKKTKSSHVIEVISSYNNRFDNVSKNTVLRDLIQQDNMSVSTPTSISN